jgi:hypothetical protein
MATNEQKTKNTVVEIAPSVAASTTNVNSGSSAAGETGLLATKKHKVLLVLNGMTILFAVISLSCAGGFNKGNWDGSHAGFLLFVGLTSIFVTAALIVCRWFFDTDPRATHVLYTDVFVNLLYSVFWFATAVDNAVQRGKLDNVCGNDFYGISCGKIDAAIAFAFFACFSSIAATTFATMIVVKQRWNA